MKLYYDVRLSGLPNYMSVRRPVPSQIQCDAWGPYLEGYSDKVIIDFLRYGWPVSYTADNPPTSADVNHASATRHQAAVSAFISKELSKDAILGPFFAPPFEPWTQCSPLMTRDKPDGSGKRVIVDLWYPSGQSVNDGIRKNFTQGVDSSYSLPTAWDLAALMLSADRPAFMWKADLQRAYRQLRVDPLDYPLLGLSHDNLIYTDICPSFGCRASGASQQRVSNAIVHIMGGKGHHLLAYVDDFCGVASTFHHAVQGLADFEALTQELGLALAPEKTAFPTTRLEWLGYMFDSKQMEISIPKEKLDEVIKETDAWADKVRATKQQLQSLAGKLNFISSCVRPARRFMTRILDTLRAAHAATSVNITDDFRKDVAWFGTYAKNCNTNVLICPKLPTINIECDACLVGGGGHSDTEFYDVIFPEGTRDRFHISHNSISHQCCCGAKNSDTPTLAPGTRAAKD